MRTMTYPWPSEENPMRGINGWRYTESNVWPVDGKWHHLVVTYEEHADGNPNSLRVKMYLDANLVLNDASSGGGVVGPEMDHILIGSLGSRVAPVGDPFLFTGYIDEFAIYAGALSACRVKAHYKAWQPKSCAEMRDRGIGIKDFDRNQDCRIDFDDFAGFALDWRKCNNPQDPNCPNNWLQFRPPSIAATEVISIDLNKQGNDIAYSGKGAVDGNAVQVWRAYYAGWGKAMGSPRSSDLADYNEPCMPSVYAAQVWIGVDANGATYETYGPCDVNLMTDGFRKTGGGAANPCIHLWGQGAYGGTTSSNTYPYHFDIYVYGGGDGNASSFTLTQAISGRSETNSISGGFDGNFVQTKNYVVFRDVNIGGVDSNDANSVAISFTGAINGLQLVKLKTRFECVKDDLSNYGSPSMGQGFEVNATAWDVAYDTNRRAGESTYFGPDLGIINELPYCGADANVNAPCVMYIDGGEYMKYDINVPAASQGNYNIYAWVDTTNGSCSNLNVYIDDIPLGTLQQTNLANYFQLTTDSYANGNLFAGPHTFKWQSSALEGYNLWRFEFQYVKGIYMPDCSAVYTYGFNYAGDFNKNCYVDFNDLKILANEWLTCYDPNQKNCP
jgi:hypothetical protein